MIGMTLEKLLDALAVDTELFFERKKDAHRRECQLTLGIGHWRAAAELGGTSKELQPARSALGAPQVAAVQEFFPFSFTGFFQSLGGAAPDRFARP